MPFDHIGNTANGNAMAKVNPTAGQGLAGRTTALAIMEVNYTAFKNHDLSGPDIDNIVIGIKPDGDDEWEGNRREDHEDRLGNLPVAPGGGVVYREYHVTNTKFTKKGYIRLVADLTNKRLYITPTHYDVWCQNPQTAAGANVQNPIAANGSSSRNPFFLLRGVTETNDLFD